MHHRRHARGRSSRLEFEDVITVDLPDDGHVDRQYLRAVFRNPHHYLPARRRRSRYLDTPLRTRGEHPIARRAKQAGLLASISALVCAVITAAVLIEHPTRSNTAQGEQERTRNNITALGAFTTAESQHPDGTNGPAARAPQATRPEETTPGSDHADHPRGSHRNHPRRESHSTATATDGTEATDEPTPAGNTGTTPSTQTTSASGATDSGAAHSHTTADSGADSRIDTVREFYSRTTSAPGQAARLLIPNLLDQGLETLGATWRSLTDVHLRDIEQQQDGTVLTALTIRLPGGTTLYLKQLFTFADSGLINHVQLLSAQHS